MIVIYNRKTFIVEATGPKPFSLSPTPGETKLECKVYYLKVRPKQLEHLLVLHSKDWLSPYLPILDKPGSASYKHTSLLWQSSGDEVHSIKLKPDKALEGLKDIKCFHCNFAQLKTIQNIMLNKFVWAKS
jgi:hypothetical protein